MSNQVPDEQPNWDLIKLCNCDGFWHTQSNRKIHRGSVYLSDLVAKHITAEKKKLLEGLLEYNGAYIGMDGKRVDNMVHHLIIEEEIKKLDQVPSEGK